MTTVTLNWHDGLSFTATGTEGHSLLASNDKDANGKRKGFKPMELMALSVGACTAMDVISILEKKRQEVSAFEVQVHTEKMEAYPQIWSKLEIEYILTGKEIDPAAVERAIQLSADKYCPAQNMLKDVVDIQHNYKILEG